MLKNDATFSISTPISFFQSKYLPLSSCYVGKVFANIFKGNFWANCWVSVRLLDGFCYSTNNAILRFMYKHIALSTLWIHSFVYIHVYMTDYWHVQQGFPRKVWLVSESSAVKSCSICFDCTVVWRFDTPLAPVCGVDLPACFHVECEKTWCLLPVLKSSN